MRKLYAFAGTIRRPIPASTFPLSGIAPHLVAAVDMALGIPMHSLHPTIRQGVRLDAGTSRT